MGSKLTRRDVLAGSGAVLTTALAGCPTAPPGYAAKLRMTSVDNAELLRSVLLSPSAYEERDQEAELMNDILNGGATVERMDPPLPEDQHVHYDDAVYVLSHEIIERTPATTYHILVDLVQGTVVESEAVRFSELPAVDREKFTARGWDGSFVGFGSSIRYTDSEREKSALVPTPEYSYIVWEDGSEAAWSVEESYETPLNTYEYSAEQYSTATAYGQRLRDQFAFELTDLSDAEAEIVQTAIDEGEHVVGDQETPTSAFRSLAEKFRPQAQLTRLDEETQGVGDLRGVYLVRYDGTVYRTFLDI
jgi:hypothetical protein